MSGISMDPMVIAALALAVLSLILNIVLFTKTGAFDKSLKRFMSGKDAASLEDEIVELFNDNRYLKEQSDRNTEEIEEIRKRMRRHIRKKGIVKYDAFHQMGGELSYVLALLDEADNGFIINSVHSSEGSYSYIKEIKKGVSDIELGNEEAAALAKAMKSKAKTDKGEDE